MFRFEGAPDFTQALGLQSISKRGRFVCTSVIQDLMQIVWKWILHFEMRLNNLQHEEIYSR